MVELALIAPMFFGMLFATMDAGLYLYGRAAVVNGTNAMSYAVAAKGRDADADTYAIALMSADGLTTSPLVKVSEIDIFRGKASSLGVLSEDLTCSGACQNTYTVTSTPGVFVLGLNAWPPVNRDVSSGNSDFAGITVTYTYQPIFFRGASVTVKSTRYVRLEPQT